MAKYHEIQEFENHKNSFADSIRFISMAFRPKGTILFCLSLTTVLSVFLIAVIILNPSLFLSQIAIAILTGVVASGLIAIFLELSNNYRHNYKRLIVLHEYLYLISVYEEMMKSYIAPYRATNPKIEDDDDPFSDELNNRCRALADMYFNIMPIIEDAFYNGREFMEAEEITKVLKVLDASEKIKDISDDLLSRNMGNDASLFDGVSEPLKS